MELDNQIQEIAEILMGSYTPEGVQKWWHRPRKLLDNKTPMETLEQGEYEKVKELATRLLYM